MAGGVQAYELVAGITRIAAAMSSDIEFVGVEKQEVQSNRKGPVIWSWSRFGIFSELLTRYHGKRRRVRPALVLVACLSTSE